MSILRIKHTIGNIFHIKSWSDNYERNTSREALFDAYFYVTKIFEILYYKLDKYYINRGIIIPLAKYDCNIIPSIQITKDILHKIMGYDFSNKTILIHPNSLYLKPIEYRSLLVHEIIHHIYTTIHITYGEFKPYFRIYGKSNYEKNPEEFIADYWRLYYEGYNEDSIAKYLGEWYFNGDDNIDKAYTIIRRLQNCGYIPI